MINDNNIEQVTDFKYLGYHTAEYKSDLEDKLQTYNKINGAIRRHFGKQMNKQTKLRIHNIEIWKWSLGTEEKRGTMFRSSTDEIFETLTGNTKLDKEKNECIRGKMGAQNIVQEIKQYQKKWLQHVQRMATYRMPRRALRYRVEGRRNVGQPKKRWRDQLHFED